MQFEPLSSERHQQLSVNSGFDFMQYATLSRATVCVDEFASLSCSFPLFFIKDTQTNNFQSIALMSLFANNEKALPNPIFSCGDSRFVASLPNSLRQLPFALVNDPENANKLTIGIATESLQVTDTADIANSGNTDPQERWEALFVADSAGNLGQPSPYLNSVERELQQQFQAEQTTQQVINELVRHALLQELEIHLHLQNGDSSQIRGLYSINEQALNQLPNNDKLSLMNNGMLPAMYAMLASLSQLNRLIQLHSLQAEQQDVNTPKIANINVKRRS